MASTLKYKTTCKHGTPGEKQLADAISRLADPVTSKPDGTIQAKRHRPPFLATTILSGSTVSATLTTLTGALMTGQRISRTSLSVRYVVRCQCFRQAALPIATAMDLLASTSTTRLSASPTEHYHSVPIQQRTVNEHYFLDKQSDSLHEPTI